MTGLVADFLPALRDASRPAPDGVTDGAGRPAGRRFDVYRNNVAVSLIAALETGFPALRSLIGPENFRHVARRFAAGHPPASPLMMYYGQGFPEFLAGLGALAHIPYLPDVARLEFALRDSYHAADHVALTPDALAAIPPERLEHTRLAPAPSVRLLRSDWPVSAIRAFAIRDDAPKPAGGAQDVAVLRRGFDPEPVTLPAGGHAFLRALQAGEPLGKATELGARAAPDFDPGALLGLLLAYDALCQPEERQ